MSIICILGTMRTRETTLGYFLQRTHHNAISMQFLTSLSFLMITDFLSIRRHFTGHLSLKFN